MATKNKTFTYEVYAGGRLIARRAVVRARSASEANKKLRKSYRFPVVLGRLD